MISRHCRRIVHCQSDRERELISRPVLRQTDQHADETKADATETAVTGHLRPTGRRWPVTAISESSTFDESARRSVCRNSGRETERAISADSVLFSGSVAKPCAKVLRSHAHSPAHFQAISGAGSLAASMARGQMAQCRETYCNCCSARSMVM